MTTTPPPSAAHAAATGGVAVAAHYWNDPGLDDVESFSSLGPTEILFDVNGNPIQDLRETPLITGPDGVTTTTTDGGNDFSTFFGTSAAAPHIAAVAALVLEQANNLGATLGVDDLYNLLYANRGGH
jgi:subtilisin family serine protease